MVGYSRLMQGDEEEVLRRQKAHRLELIDPEIERHRGHIVKTTGDGLLVEFASIQDAVRCAISIQSEMADREIGQDENHRIQYRIGINIGDVIFDGDDIFGDGVNVAARLEELSEPGGVCISDIVHQMVADRIDQSFRDMGGQRVKNFPRPIRVWNWQRHAVEHHKTPEVALKQRVQFCGSADGTQIAWASIGEGPAVLKAPNYLNHLEYEWNSPIWGPFLSEFAASNQLVRFDQRGNGLSDADVDTISPQVMIEDMEAVVEASGLKRFALFGISQGVGFSVDYATRHPEQISCLILLNGYLRGRLKRGDPEAETFHAMSHVMMREGWGSANPVYRNIFTSTFVPDASPEIKDSFDELQRMTCSAENAIRIATMNDNMDRTELARELDVPTLVLHMHGDSVVPRSEGQRVARMIRGAQFVELPGNNHVVLQDHESFEMLFDEVRAFVAMHADR